MSVKLLAGRKVKGEENRAVVACNDYLRMGNGRSLAKLNRQYQKDTENTPKNFLRQLKKWSTLYGWVARAGIYDGRVDEKKTAKKEKADNKLYDTELARIELMAKYIKRTDKFLEDNFIIIDAEGNQVINKTAVQALIRMSQEISKETGQRINRKEIAHTWRESLPANADPDVVLEQFEEMLLAQVAKTAVAPKSKKKR